MLVQAPVLSYSDFTKSFTIYTDALGIGLGAVLSQEQGGKERVILYTSRSLNNTKKNYTVTDQECLAVVWAVKHFEQYLGLLPFKVITDHSALKFLQTADMPSRKRAHWIMYLQQFKFELFTDWEKKIKMLTPYQEFQKYNAFSPELKIKERKEVVKKTFQKTLQKLTF